MYSLGPRFHTELCLFDTHNSFGNTLGASWKAVLSGWEFCSYRGIEEASVQTGNSEETLGVLLSSSSREVELYQEELNDFWYLQNLLLREVRTWQEVS